MSKVAEDLTVTLSTKLAGKTVGTEFVLFGDSYNLVQQKSNIKDVDEAGNVTFRAADGRNTTLELSGEVKSAKPIKYDEEGAQE